MSDEKIGNKIRLLLAKTVEKGCTEAEAESALKVAERLMLQHNLSMEDLKGETAAEQEAFTTREVWRGAGRSWEMPYVINICSRRFFVKAYWSGSHVYGNEAIHFYGTPTNIDTAQFVFNFLCQEFKGRWQSYRLKRGLTHAHSRAFYEGMRDGLNLKLIHERQEFIREQAEFEALQGCGFTDSLGLPSLREKNALTRISNSLQRVSEELETSYKEFSKGMTYGSQAPTRGRSVRQAGFSEGQKINIARPLDKPTDPKIPKALPGDK